MTETIVFKYSTGKMDNNGQIGSSNLSGVTVAKAKCPYCNSASSFSQVGKGSRSVLDTRFVALECDHCQSIISAEIDNDEIHPTPEADKIEGVPPEIDEYYSEGIRCIGANAPNGAATVFRKVIHAVCEYYDLTDVESDESFYSMINSLSEEGAITETLRESLLGVKDAGNDGAHLNANDPGIEQAREMKEIVDAVLTATVVADQKVSALREDHPNPHQE